MDEHSKLARIAVELPLGAEHLFQINVAKMSVGIPKDLRSDLRALASTVVAEAQRSYREHAATGATPDHRAPTVRPAAVVDAGGAVRIGRDWVAISRILGEELGHDPQLRDRLLLRLANAPTPTDREVAEALAPASAG